MRICDALLENPATYEKLFVRAAGLRNLKKLIAAKYPGWTVLRLN